MKNADQTRRKEQAIGRHISRNVLQASNAKLWELLFQVLLARARKPNWVLMRLFVKLHVRISQVTLMGAELNV